MIILLITISGAVLLFADDIHRLSFPELANVKMESEHYASTLEQLDFSQLQLVKFPQPHMNAFRVWFKDHSEAFIKPDTGEIIEQWHWNESIPSFLFELHTTLFLGNSGEIINGLVGIGVLFSIISGILLWWRRWKIFDLKFALPYKFSLKTLLFNHAATGVIASIPVMLFIITGITMVFYSSVEFMLTGLLDEQKPSRVDRVVMPEQRAMSSWQEILSKVDEVFPEGQLVYLYPSRPDNAAIVFRKRLPGEWHPNGRSYIVINPYGAKVIQTIDARSEELGVRIMNTVYPLHAAKVGGWLYKSIALMSSILLIILLCTGLLSYLRTVRRKVVI